MEMDDIPACVCVYRYVCERVFKGGEPYLQVLQPLNNNLQQLTGRPPTSARARRSRSIRRIQAINIKTQINRRPLRQRIPNLLNNPMNAPLLKNIRRRHNSKPRLLIGRDILLGIERGADAGVDVAGFGDEAFARGVVVGRAVGVLGLD
jgi:hypothetical protein